MKPVIAIPQMGTDLFRQYMKAKYVKSLKKSGADVRWIALSDSTCALQEALSCDGLLLPGGADINPQMYGQPRSSKCGTPNKVRDTAEPVIFRGFVETGKPVLAICRGMQMMNVCLHGTLQQDIKDTQTFNHSDFASRTRYTHCCKIENNSQIFSILGEREIRVNSMHHQAVDTVGTGLTVAAVSEDGFVEALELEGHPFCIGVQWHPEHMYQKDHTQRKLFQAFVDAGARS